MSPIPVWKSYQEEAAAHFRSLGFHAETDVRISGVRTHHDVDVLLQSDHGGFKVKWIVECKYWTTRVSKLHVMALREIVADVGADRGLLLAENGFQSGALEAATMTNVVVTSLHDARRSAEFSLRALRLAILTDRVARCHSAYWAIPKAERIKAGLRTEFEPGYSGTLAIMYMEELLRIARRQAFPESIGKLDHTSVSPFPTILHSVEEALDLLERLVGELEVRLETA